jgi:hypothetical protein
LGGRKNLYHFVLYAQVTAPLIYFSSPKIIVLLVASDSVVCKAEHSDKLMKALTDIISILMRLNLEPGL